jgi:hypothetical protein
MNRLLIAAGLGLAAGACAPASNISAADQARVPDAPGACFRPQSVNNFRPGDEGTVYVRAGRGQVFEIRTSPCFGLDSALSLSIVQPVGSGAQACVGDPVNLVVAQRGLSVGNTGACRAEVIRPLTKAEIAALPSRFRP